MGTYRLFWGAFNQPNSCNKTLLSTEIFTCLSGDKLLCNQRFGTPRESISFSEIMQPGMSFLKLSHLPCLALMCFIMGNCCLIVVSLETFLSTGTIGENCSLLCIFKKLACFPSCATRSPGQVPSEPFLGKSGWSLSISRGNRRAWPEKWGLMDAHSGFVQGMHPSDSKNASLICLGVLRMAREGVHGKQALFWIFPVPIAETAEREAFACRYTPGDIIQTSNFAPSNTMSLF